MGQKRAAIYCRVSTADQSCERQEHDLLTFAERAGYEVVGVHKETGSGVKLDRAERKKVLALAQAREIDAEAVGQTLCQLRLPAQGYASQWAVAQPTQRGGGQVLA